jgi:hypothetical protein
MASKRSHAQKEHLAAIRALRQQEGGPGPSGVIPEDLLATQQQLQSAESARDNAQLALQRTKAKLEAEHSHSKDLYRALRVETRKVSRNQAAKANAEACAAETQQAMEGMELQLQQLTLKNDQLEMTMSQLLEKWAKDAQIADSTLQQCRKQIRALKAKCAREPEILRKAVAKAQMDGNKFSLIEKGVYTEEARELCRVLVHAGCAQELVGKVIEEVLTTAGISVVGPTMSQRTVARAILEGGVMADIQLGHEMSKTSSLTASSDGTTHKNVNYESRHINMPVSTYDVGNPDIVKHRSRLVGVDSATDHSSQTQVEGWKHKLQEKLDIYSQSPLARRSQVTLKLADFFSRLQGMNGDHAKDQKKLASLLKEMKAYFMHQELGEERLLDMEISDINELLTRANNQKIAEAGGPEKWDALSKADQLEADATMMSAVVLKLGSEAYSHLPEDEKHKAEFFVWVGCAMHKDLNCVKAGNTEMMAWWDQNEISGPILLANKDNAAVLDQVDDEDDYTATEQRAHDVSSGGGVKLASLAGMIFNNKNDKVGQQDTYQQFFLSRGLKKPKFPDTSNTRYQSHCAAAAELITNHKLYIEFMKWIKNSKDKPGFTNVEKNVYNGLQDVPTQTELAVLALYAQAISHPYMRHVRGPGTEQVNMLNLGPLHLKVQKHLESIIKNPHLLLSPCESYKHGAMDGKPWENPEVMDVIYALVTFLPYIQPVLVAFFKGALKAWKRFTAEFQEGGLIDCTTAEEKEKAWMPPTNDVNEGALGALRLHLRKKPNTTMHQYNALAMFKFNDTAVFVHAVFNEEDHMYVRQMARNMDSSHLEAQRKAALISFKDKQMMERREKAAQKAQQKNEEEIRLAKIKHVESVEEVTTSMTAAQLKDNLEIYRRLVEGIPLKSHLRTKAEMIEALKDAIKRYKTLSGMQNRECNAVGDSDEE